MKNVKIAAYLITVMLGIIPFSVQASTNDLFSPITTRILTDPLYLPLRGQFMGVTGYTRSISSYNGYNYLDVETASHRSYGDTFAQTFAYGMFDNLTLRINDSYVLNTNDSTSEKTGALTTSSAEGFSNPTLSFTYRAMDQKSYPVDIDLTASYSPDMLTSKSGSSTEKGTIANGRQVAGLTLAVGREMKLLSIQGSINATYLGKRKYESLSNGNEYETDADWQYNIGLNTQTRISDRLSLNLGAGYTLVDNYDGSNTTTGVSWNAYPAKTFGLNSAINYHFIPNKFVGTLFYSHNIYSNSRNEYVKTTSNNETKEYSANLFGGRLSYVF